MHQKQRGQSKSRLMSSLKGVSHLSRRAKRRLFCKLQLWMWRRRKEIYRYGIYRTRKHSSLNSSGSSSCLSVKSKSQKKKLKVPENGTPHSQTSSSTLVSPLGGENGGSEETLWRDCEFESPPETLPNCCSSQNQSMDSDFASGNVEQSVPSQNEESLMQTFETSNPLKVPLPFEPLCKTEDETCCVTNVKESRTLVQAHEPEPDDVPGLFTPAIQDQTTCTETDGTIISKTTVSSQADASLKVLAKHIHEFLNDFYVRYGSFIPLQNKDVLKHLKKKFITGVSERKNFIVSEVIRWRTTFVQEPVLSFQLVYKKHTLTLDDLSTLADQNWLNDQVMNMYGELIMESAHSKVHFLNSFFHRQLMTKGYDGVKRWTKQVDLFSKSLLLVPIHLEVHWCLVSADIVNKKICLYDSQGNALQKIGRNILKYLMTEAKEKNQTDFEDGWGLSFDEEVPQQTNENDCGVFVLEYSRCLALDRPLQFSQKDIPKIRKRIYKELCECKLHEKS